MEAWQIGLLGGGAAVIMLLVLSLQSRRLQALLRTWRRAKLLELFSKARPELLRKFFAQAAASGSPRGLRWRHAEWEPTQTLSRERATGLYVMLVPVTLLFEAVEGGDMEDAEAVGLAKQATGLFYFVGGRWRTAGKAVFNLSPEETLRHFAAQYEHVD